MTDDRRTDDFTVHFKRLHPDARAPERGTAFAAGWDFYAVEDVTLPPGEWSLVPTGLAIALPPGYELQLRPRSGLALRHGVTLLNAPGTIDADYRGEVKVLMINHGSAPFVAAKATRIAQGVVARHAELTWSEVDALPESDRGQGGFGHTGSS